MRIGALTAAALGALVAAGCGEEGAPAREDGRAGGDQLARGLVPADGEISFGESRVIATIALHGGTVLRFLEIAPRSIVLLEEAPAGAASIGAVRDLPLSASPADVFFSFAEPGEEIPAALLDAAPLTLGDRPQGWARALAAPQAITTGNCNDTNFRAWFSRFPYNDRDTPDFRLNQVPDSSGFFERYAYAPGNGQSYRFYRYVVGGNDGSIWYNLDRYVTRVAICALDAFESENPGNKAHPSISYQGYENPHMGPVVRVMYHRPGETVWSLATAKDFSPGDVGKVLSWHFYTGLNWDFRTDIYWAGGDDSFDIGHAVEDL